MRNLLFLFILTYISTNGQSPGAGSDKARITPINMGKGTIIFPIIKLADQNKENSINSFLISSVFGQDYNINNFKQKLESLYGQTSSGSMSTFNPGGFGVSYETNFNEKNILVLTITTCGGAHGTCNSEQYCFDLTTGYSFGIDQIIFPSKKGDLRKKISDELQSRLVESKKDLINQNLWNELKDSWNEELKDANAYYDYDLSHFEISEKGITFKHELFSFPRVYQNFNPSSEYFFQWNQISVFLLPSTPVNKIILRK